MITLKTKANEQFIARTNNPNNFKQLVAKGYVMECGDTLFLYDRTIDLWVASSAKHSYVFVTNPPQHERYWTLGTVKYGFLGPVFKRNKRLINTIEFTPEQLNDVIGMIMNNDYSFEQLYSTLKDRLSLPEYKLKRVN